MGKTAEVSPSLSPGLPSVCTHASRLEACIPTLTRQGGGGDTIKPMEICAPTRADAPGSRLRAGGIQYGLSCMRDYPQRIFEHESGPIWPSNALSQPSPGLFTLKGDAWESPGQRLAPVTKASGDDWADFQGLGGHAGAFSMMGLM
jgi:hypothetical protein